MSAGLESRVHVRWASGNGPTRGLSVPFASVPSDPARSRPGAGPAAVPADDVLLRLALWLSDVAAEAVAMTAAPEPHARALAPDPPPPREPVI